MKKYKKPVKSKSEKVEYYNPNKGITPNLNFLNEGPDELLCSNPNSKNRDGGSNSGVVPQA